MMVLRCFHLYDDTSLRQSAGKTWFQKSCMLYILSLCSALSKVIIRPFLVNFPALLFVACALAEVVLGSEHLLSTSSELVNKMLFSVILFVQISGTAVVLREVSRWITSHATKCLTSSKIWSLARYHRSSFRNVGLIGCFFNVKKIGRNLRKDLVCFTKFFVFLVIFNRLYYCSK